MKTKMETKTKTKEEYCYADPFGITSCNCKKCQEKRKKKEVLKE